MPSAVPLIVNPSSGRGRGAQVAMRVARILADASFPVELVQTHSADESRQLAADVASRSARCLIVCGGDGTVHSVANVLAHTETALTIIPAGRGNDLARALGLHIPVERLAAQIIGDLKGASDPPRIDLGRMSDRFFCTVATFGVDAAVSRAVEERAAAGPTGATYVTATIRELFRYMPREARLSGDFGTRELPLLLCATANTPNYGGVFCIAPSARIDDALFHVCAIRGMSAFRALMLMPRVICGSHVSDPRVEVMPTRELTLEAEEACPIYADGEFLGMTPARLSVAPGALRVFGARLP